MRVTELSFNVAVSSSSNSKKWKNISMTWGEIQERFGTAVQTKETHKEFINLPKSEQGIIKDVGAFVGGELNGERRIKSAMLDRSLLALDVDFGDENFPSRFEDMICCAFIIHGTHKHNPKVGMYRYRILIPLSRPVDGDEYEALGRKVAELTGIDLYDRTTFQPERCMYYPSVPSDVAYYFYDSSLFRDNALDVDEYLGMYEDYLDTSEWAYHKDEKNEVRSLVKEQQNPIMKTGVVGEFCRAYTISEVIERYLSDVYEPSDIGDDRYTYLGGTTHGGMIVFDDMFAKSYHNNDPIQGNHVYNAYDLVRVHKFGKMDKEDDKKSTAMMLELINKDEKVAAMRRDNILGKGKQVANDLDDFNELVGGDDEMNDEDFNFDFDSKGNMKPNANNISQIFKADQALKGLIAKDEFKDRIILTRKPAWRNGFAGDDFRDVDFAGIRVHIENKYGISAANKIDDAIQMEAEKNSFHPVKDYLTKLVWDGTPRVDTLLIDFMKAEDTLYTREAIRIMLVGAVRRIFRAGYKFDSMLVLQSGQGAGKSKLISLLGKSWFSDSLSTMDGKAAYEQLQGNWILEVAELSAMKKAEVEGVKNFISKTEDNFRPAYGRVTVNYKRQCVFFGTTNQYEFLKDTTGGRRFLPVVVEANERTADLFKPEMKEYIDQVWAEAVKMHYDGVSTLLSPEAENVANDMREEHLEVDSRAEDVERYLEMRVPSDWYDMNQSERKMYFDNYDPSMIPDSYDIADFVPTNAIMVEVFGLSAEKRSTQMLRTISGIMNSMCDWDRSKRRLCKAYGNANGYVRKGSDLDLFG